MKGLSIVFTVLLLVFAHQLATRMRHSGTLPATQRAQETPASYAQTGPPSSPTRLFRL